VPCGETPAISSSPSGFDWTPDHRRIRLKRASPPVRRLSKPPPPEAAVPKTAGARHRSSPSPPGASCTAGSAPLRGSARTGNSPEKNPEPEAPAPEFSFLGALPSAPIRIGKRRRPPACWPFGSSAKMVRMALAAAAAVVAIRAAVRVSGLPAASRRPVAGLATAGFFATGPARRALGRRTHADLEPRVQRHQRTRRGPCWRSPTARSTRTSIWTSPCSAAAASSIHPPPPTWFSDGGDGGRSDANHQRVGPDLAHAGPRPCRNPGRKAQGFKGRGGAGCGKAGERAERRRCSRCRVRPGAGGPGEVRPNAAPLKRFNAESLSQRLRPVRSADMPDAPEVAAEVRPYRRRSQSV